MKFPAVIGRRDTCLLCQLIDGKIWVPKILPHIFCGFNDSIVFRVGGETGITDEFCENFINNRGDAVSAAGIIFVFQTEGFFKEQPIFLYIRNFKHLDLFHGVVEHMKVDHKDLFFQIVALIGDTGGDDADALRLKGDAFSVAYVLAGCFQPKGDGRKGPSGNKDTLFF